MLMLVKKKLHAFIVFLKFKNKKFKKIGDNSKYKGLSSQFLYEENISIGANVCIGPGAMIDGAGGVDICEGCIFAPDVKIYSRTHNFECDLQALPFDNIMLTAPVLVERYVWIGTNVVILPGVTIGEGAVIGAGAVVSKNIPAYAIAVGNPAKVVRYRNKEQFQALLVEGEPFVYKKLGHAKVFKPKSEIK